MIEEQRIEKEEEGETEIELRMNEMSQRSPVCRVREGWIQHQCGTSQRAERVWKANRQLHY